jgi:ADP-ribose pyrophosphatase YjhB (NUDIX family)
MNYCSHCGEKVTLAIPPEDDRSRYICTSCGTIHYQNPKVIAGCIPEWNGQILLCKRAIEPRYGYWTLPAGFMELGETTPEAAIRETLEEANARVEIQALYAVINLPHVDQVYMMFLSRLLDLDFSPGHESEVVELYREEDIPWDNIAFTTIRQTLKFFFDDQRSGQFPLHTGDITRLDGKYVFRPGPPDTEVY